MALSSTPHTSTPQSGDGNHSAAVPDVELLMEEVSMK
jgi:hypothetical protein